MFSDDKEKPEQDSEDEFIKLLFEAKKAIPIKNALKRHPKQGMFMDLHDFNEENLLDNVENLVEIPPEQDSEDEFFKVLFECKKSTPVKSTLKRHSKQGMFMDLHDFNEENLLENIENLVEIPKDAIIDSFIMEYDETNIVQILENDEIEGFILEYKK